MESRALVHVSPRPPGRVATIASVVEQAVAPAIELATRGIRSADAGGARFDDCFAFRECWKSMCDARSHVVSELHDWRISPNVMLSE